jgi:two-component system, response regulator YesN
MSTLLIADDERTIREGIASSVDWASLGISRVLLASNGRKARAMIAAEKPDVAIIDIVMPEMTGIELITQCRKERDCPEFVIISGHDEFAYAQEALRNHVHNYILKPCDAAEIAETVRTVLRELEQRRAAEAERRDLQERLDVLEPGARAQLLADFITGARVSPGRLQALRRTYDPGTTRFQLLILLARGRDSARTLRAMEKAAAARPGLPSRFQTAPLEDSLVVLFTPEDRGVVEGFVEGIREELATGCAGRSALQAALSAPGDFDALPQLYVAAREALHRVLLTRGGVETGLVCDATDSSYGATVQRVMRLIEEHYMDGSLSLGAVSKDVLRLNSDYVGKLFKKECGLTFSEYLMAVRMEQAKRIISASDGVRIYEVAARVGFGDDAAYFSRVFHRYAGVAPGEYRRKNDP